jgi:hypothetical protein
MGPQLALERGEAEHGEVRHRNDRSPSDLTRCRRGLWSANPRDT